MNFETKSQILELWLYAIFCGIHFDRVHERDRQTDRWRVRQTDTMPDTDCPIWRHRPRNPRLYMASCGKNQMLQGIANLVMRPMVVSPGEFNGIIPERLSVCSERFCDSGCNCFHFNVASTSLQRNIVTKQAIKKTVFAGTR